MTQQEIIILKNSLTADQQHQVGILIRSAFRDGVNVGRMEDHLERTLRPKKRLAFTAARRPSVN